MSVQQTVVVLGMASCLAPVFAILVRGRSRELAVATICAAASLIALFSMVLRLVQLGPSSEPNFWVYGVMGFSIPVCLSGYLLALGFGRDDARESFRRSRAPFVLLGLVGLAFLMVLRHDGFVTGYDWASGRGTIHLGGLGKAFFTYLLVGIVLAGQGLERTYRASSGNLRYRLRIPMLGFIGFLAYATFLLTGGMLYSAVGMGKLVALAVPVGFASLALSYGYLRGGITDLATPVSREIVYSSFSAFAAGLFIVAIGVAAQIATLTKWSPDEIVVLSFGFLALLVALLLLLSNRFQRMVRRYIDRNFYVNRYDYRTQWSTVTDALVEATDRDAVIERAEAVLREAFLADALTISLEDRSTGMIRPIIGRGTGLPQAVLGPNCPLCQELIRGRKSLLLDRKTDDFTYIPIYAENRDWLEQTSSQIVAPLLHGDRLLGVAGLERSHEDDPFTFEDVALLDRVAAHVSAVLHSTELAAELAETREVELMSQWSSMIVHDLKNYLTPLRMVARNLIEKQSRPDIAERCARDLDLVADKMEKLVQTLRQLREDPGERITLLCPNELVREVMRDLQTENRPGLRVDLRLQATQTVRADGAMLRRVIENLVTNALEAMDGKGTVIIATNDCESREGRSVCVDVIDDGRGIPAEFLQNQLFRPFATTKKKGLGLGLYQCRSIIRSHGGELSVQSREGDGATFRISLPAQEPNGSVVNLAVPLARAFSDGVTHG